MDMEHDFIIISSNNEMGQKNHNCYISDYKVEYLGQFMEVSYVVRPPTPLQYVRLDLIIK